MWNDVKKKNTIAKFLKHKHVIPIAVQTTCFEINVVKYAQGDEDKFLEIYTNKINKTKQGTNRKTTPKCHKVT